MRSPEFNTTDKLIEIGKMVQIFAIQKDEKIYNRIDTLLSDIQSFHLEVV
jgi:hypothetical protein